MKNWWFFLGLNSHVMVNKMRRYHDAQQVQQSITSCKSLSVEFTVWFHLKAGCRMPYCDRFDKNKCIWVVKTANQVFCICNKNFRLVSSVLVVLIPWWSPGYATVGCCDHFKKNVSSFHFKTISIQIEAYTVEYLPQYLTHVLHHIREGHVLLDNTDNVWWRYPTRQVSISKRPNTVFGNLALTQRNFAVTCTTTHVLHWSHA